MNSSHTLIKRIDVHKTEKERIAAIEEMKDPPEIRLKQRKTVQPARAAPYPT